MKILQRRNRNDSVWIFLILAVNSVRLSHCLTISTETLDLFLLTLHNIICNTNFYILYHLQHAYWQIWTRKNLLVHLPSTRSIAVAIMVYHTYCDCFECHIKNNKNNICWVERVRIKFMQYSTISNEAEPKLNAREFLFPSFYCETEILWICV